jgi:anti-anti-sigma regulatory factor
LDLDAVDAGQVGRADALSLPPLLVDCGQLQLQLLRTRGVSHVVSLLLELRGRGATICLCKMPPALARCLQLLRVDQLFPVVD